MCYFFRLDVLRVLFCKPFPSLHGEKGLNFRVKKNAFYMKDNFELILFPGRSDGFEKGFYLSLMEVLSEMMLKMFLALPKFGGSFWGAGHATVQLSQCAPANM